MSKVVAQGTPSPSWMPKNPMVALSSEAAGARGHAERCAEHNEDVAAPGQYRDQEEPGDCLGYEKGTDAGDVAVAGQPQVQVDGGG